MGAAKHARRTKVLVDGNDLSNYFNQADADNAVPMLDSTCFDEATPDKTFEPGTPEGKVSLKGLFRSKAGETDPLDRDAVDDILTGMLGDATKSYVVTVAQEGLDAAGLTATVFQTKLTKYSVTAPHDALISCMGEMQADGGLRYGYALAPLVSRSASGSGTAVDLGAASAKGFEANFHVTDDALTDDLELIVEDSADGATGWASIGQAVLTARGAGRASSSGNVRRYVRLRWVFNGVGDAATFTAAFALKTY